MTTLTQAIRTPNETDRVIRIGVQSPGFNSQGEIPRRYTADGANINPALLLSRLPDATQSMVLLMEDPDAPVDTWTHWLVWNIYPTTKINENSIPGIVGLNSFRQSHYTGPCPPSGNHHYFFKVFALDTVLAIPRNSTKYEVMRAIKDHVVGYGELIGSYQRNNQINLGYYA